jgi:hypothetical protein
MPKIGRKIGVLICAAGLSMATLTMPIGCATTYYSIWEKLGYEKRDILVDRVQAAADSQTKAKEQFKTTMQQFQDLTGFKGGDLEAEYQKLKDSYDKCKDRADAVSSKIAKVNEVANAMFNEWAANLDQYSDQSLRASSEQKLNESKARYAQLYAAMQNSEAKMKPVLVAFADRVHYLNDNLNYAAINSLSDTNVKINTDVQGLIQDMDASINEANAFIENMKKT